MSNPYLTGGLIGRLGLEVKGNSFSISSVRKGTTSSSGSIPPQQTSVGFRLVRHRQHFSTAVRWWTPLPTSPPGELQSSHQSAGFQLVALKQLPLPNHSECPS